MKPPARAITLPELFNRSQPEKHFSSSRSGFVSEMCTESLFCPKV